MKTSTLLAASSTATYKRYIIVGKIMIKHQGVLLLLVNLDREAPTAKIHGTMHLVDRRLYISFDKDILFIT